jgi:nitroreductase
MTMQPVSTANLLTQLKWRYAVKQFDATKKIPAETWSALEESLVLSASSFGLQPWKFFIVQTPSIREKLLPHTWGQKQVVDASHVVVFALKENVGAADAEKLVARSSEVRGIPLAALDGYKNIMIGSLGSKSQADVDAWMTHQVYIALGSFLVNAALVGVDACPMEGFMPAKYDEILGLPAKGYRSIVVATAGYRAADDKYATLAKVRYPIAEMVEHL